MKEIWKDIPGYEGLYQINNKGYIYSLHSNKILKNIIDKSIGYYFINLRKNKKTYKCYPHRLLMQSFIGVSKLYVNHKDGNKLNNSLKNLEYCTQKENIYHARKIGLMNDYGEKNGMSKLTNSDAIIIRKLKGKVSQKAIANLFDVHRTCISAIHTGRSWGTIGA